MIKPTIFIIMLLMASLIVAVFQVEHRVEVLKSDLKELNRQIEEDKNATHVLHAEWSYLNSPDRIMELSKKHLKMEYSKVHQFKNIEDIPMRKMYFSQAMTTEISQ